MKSSCDMSILVYCFEKVLEDFMTYMKPKVLQVIDILHNYKPDDNFMIIGDETLGEMDDGEETDSSLDLSDHEFAEPEPERKKKDDGQKPQVNLLYSHRECTSLVLNIFCEIVFR